MPAGRAAALGLEELDVPAEPAVLPAEPDGDEPTVPLLVPAVLPDAMEPGGWFLMELVLTSQHWLADGAVGLDGVC
jgi:hypothetical protein